MKGASIGCKGDRECEEVGVVRGHGGVVVCSLTSVPYPRTHPFTHPLHPPPHSPPSPTAALTLSPTPALTLSPTPTHGRML